LPARRIVTARGCIIALALAAIPAAPAGAVAAAASAPAASRETDLAGARAFLTRLYSRYGGKIDHRAFDPIGADAPAVFDPAMVALFAEDDRLAEARGYGERAVTYDPICNCLSDETLAFKVSAVRAAGPGRARATVKIETIAASPPDADQRLELTLVQVDGRWRIEDIGTQDRPSLKAFLIESNRGTLP
jgi:hypothetical protein